MKEAECFTPPLLRFNELASAVKAAASAVAKAAAAEKQKDNPQTAIVAKAATALSASAYI